MKRRLISDSPGARPAHRAPGGPRVCRARLVACALLLGLLLLPAGPALAHEAPRLPGSGYDLSWWTIDGGGGAHSASAGPGYILGGAIGQPDAGALSGPGYTLRGGFWQSGGRPYRVYLPLVMHGWP